MQPNYCAPKMKSAFTEQSTPHYYLDSRIAYSTYISIFYVQRHGKIEKDVAKEERGEREENKARLHS